MAVAGTAAYTAVKVFLTSDQGQSIIKKIAVFLLCLLFFATSFCAAGFTQEVSGDLSKEFSKIITETYAPKLAEKSKYPDVKLMCAIYIEIFEPITPSNQERQDTLNKIVSCFFYTVETKYTEKVKDEKTGKVTTVTKIKTEYMAVEDDNTAIANVDQAFSNITIDSEQKNRIISIKEDLFNVVLLYGASSDLAEYALQFVGESHTRFTTYKSKNGSGFGDEWCAMFVSYCTDQLGYIDAGVIDWYVGCSTEYKILESRGQFRLANSGYIPQSGDIIFFGTLGLEYPSYHTGIVTSCDGSTVYTVEGNTSGSAWYNTKVAEHSYSINSNCILGYFPTNEYVRGNKAEEKTPVA